MASRGKKASGTSKKPAVRKRDAAKRGILRALGAELRRRREAAGISQIELAADAGVSQNVVGMIERGLYNPSVVVLAAVAGRLGVSLSALFSGAESLDL